MNAGEDNKFDIYFFWSGADLLKLKEWVDARVAAGDRRVELDISWGYYDDIDNLTLVSYPGKDKK